MNKKVKPTPKFDKIEKEKSEDRFNCPKCNNRSVVPNGWSGIKCITPDCGYWFCY